MVLVFTRLRNFRLAPETAVKFTKFTVYLTCIWPPQKKSYIIWFNIFYLFSIFLAVALLLPLIIAINMFSDNIYIVMKSAILISGIVNFLIKVFIVRIYRTRFQVCFCNNFSMDYFKILIILYYRYLAVN